MNTIIQQKFAVPYQYPVCFSEAIFETSNEQFVGLLGKDRLSKILFVVDEGVAKEHPLLLDQIQAYSRAFSDRFILASDPIVVPGGEASKNDEAIYKQIVEATHLYGIDRHSYIAVIGGGAVIDMAGFAAAISHRGIRLIRIPTTVLSQNDSAVGVKNSVNAYGKKNYLGTFTPPYAVLNDFNFLKTLDDRDWRSGISEAIKVALIKDLSFFTWMEGHATALAAREMEPMKSLIIRCAQMHLDHIAGKDPFEFGSSRPLDFGHWAAHKLEHLSKFRIRHGEAVAIGIVLDSTYSFLKGWISEEDLSRIVRLFKQLGFSLFAPELAGENLIKGLQEFQEHLGGQLTIMLLAQLGQGEEVHEMDHQLIYQAVDMLKDFQEKSTLVNS
ncbi:3-dehydroquinate synthase [Algoriphagus halophytocola]|uniref:3-dehydroquinate synthase n=1 Tax=Algoriphagus halophytocola TaxID=2991499 RepID=A0ABY6MGS9_9BACT|nr:3-dehydroquinate synthase [Algoriphagus sp. TR-M5]UZD21399.1 3-dehydroquinate synthase [Algoriphagus sp. TR-M5]